MKDLKVGDWIKANLSGKKKPEEEKFWLSGYIFSLDPELTFVSKGLNFLLVPDWDEYELLSAEQAMLGKLEES